MKVKKCPARKHCFDYKENNCDNCNFGNEFTKLHKRIYRLKKQNETLTIQRNAWALTAKALEEKWISVEERLPEIYQDVLWSDGRSVGIDFRTFDGKWYDGDCHEPTHWMPLPEAPKGGAE